MSKVAINGRNLPLAPMAGAIAGLLAAVAFFLLPQSVLEALVYQLRLDTILPMAKPPLGFTARLLAAIGAGVATGAFTAFLAWKFGASVGGTSADVAASAGGRSRRFGKTEAAVDAAQIAAAEDEGMTMVTPPEAEPELVEKKSRFSFKRKQKQEEVDVANMPVTRNRGLTGSAPRSSVFDHDDQNSNNSLDISTATDSMQERHVDLPEWAYSEDCDLSGVRSGITQPADGGISLDYAVPEIDETADPFAFESVAKYDEPEKTVPAYFAPEEIEPAPAIPARYDPAADDLSTEPPATLDQAPDGTVIGWQDDAFELKTSQQAETGDDWGEADWSTPAGEDVYYDETQGSAAPLELMDEQSSAEIDVAIGAEEPAVQSSIAAGLVDRSPVEDASYDELLDRIEAGLKRKAEARAAVKQVEATIVDHPVTEVPQSQPPQDPNPFAGFEHKEAEVDEALRAALSTLERMNRRSA